MAGCVWRSWGRNATFLWFPPTDIAMRCLAFVRFPAPAGLTRATAQAFYNEQWRERLRTVYGAMPQVEYFDVHAMVDNDSGTMRIEVQP